MVMTILYVHILDKTAHNFAQPFTETRCLPICLKRIQLTSRSGYLDHLREIARVEWIVYQFVAPSISIHIGAERGVRADKILGEYSINDVC